ncbi:MAG: hypothetical protein JXA13_13970 [Anaerolineales bacterium]|nr:hypothetical protein [Anaerolineales bacterium]
MKKTQITTILLIMIILSLLAACGPQTAPTPDMETVVQTAIAATATAEANFRQAVDQAVQATVTSMPPTPTPGTAIDYITLTEEEMNALIDQAVAEAQTATTTSTTAATEAVSDGTLTDEEVYELLSYLYAAEAAAAYADELIYAYYDLYAEIAYETIDLLMAIEEDLSEILFYIEEASSILEMGADAALAALDQINNALAQAQTRASELPTRAQAWNEQVKTKINEREDFYANIQATEVYNNRVDAFVQAHDFLDAYKGALQDGKFTPDELANISLLGANAEASLSNTGDPLLLDFANRIDGLTRNASRGEWPQARSGIGELETTLPRRPSGPTRR